MGRLRGLGADSTNFPTESIRAPQKPRRHEGYNSARKTPRDELPRGSVSSKPKETGVSMRFECALAYTCSRQMLRECPSVVCRRKIAPPLSNPQLDVVIKAARSRPSEGGVEGRWEPYRMRCQKGHRDRGRVLRPSITANHFAFWKIEHQVVSSRQLRL